MILAAPIVGGILAACGGASPGAAASAAANAAPSPRQSREAEAANLAAFMQTLTNVEQASAAKTPPGTTLTS